MLLLLLLHVLQLLLLLRWLLLASPSFCWLLLAARAYCRVHPAAPGFSWLFPAAPAGSWCSWLLLASPGCSWLLVAAPGCPGCGHYCGQKKMVVTPGRAVFHQLLLDHSGALVRPEADAGNQWPGCVRPLWEGDYPSAPARSLWGTRAARDRWW